MSTTAVAARVREAMTSGRKLRISGGGSWMSAGRPTIADEIISVADDSGVVEYVPDDLTITVRAGTTLDEIRAVTRAHNQWLPLDPPGGSHGTIGATIATASSGPLAHGFGFTRDLILGVEFVSGKGDVVRSGGRVVKNVAGFDMMRLTCGAWGTLGVVTEASLRLYALPKVDRTFAVNAPEGGDDLSRFLGAVRNAPLTAYSLELIGPALAPKLGLPRRTVMLARLAGSPALVDAERKALDALAHNTEVDTSIWDSLSDAHSEPTTFSVQLSSLPTNVAQSWNLAAEMSKTDGSALSHATFSRGIIRVAGFVNEVAWMPRSDATLRVRHEILPPGYWDLLSPTVVADRLSLNVKAAFDPRGILNPGILG